MPLRAVMLRLRRLRGAMELRGGVVLAVVTILTACGADTLAPSPPASPATGTPEAVTSASAAPASPSASSSPRPGAADPAPGSDSALYAPNPGAIVVAVEAGHGGCLDWGVPDPEERGPEFAEKAITMAIARALADLLAADGVHAVLIRDGDEALAGDLYPPLNCEGAPFRDVNGDGVAGFGPDVPEATRTRDELQARLDRANLAGADVLVSIHVDSITDAAGTPLPIARTETFYTDETPWGVPSAERLAGEVQSALVAALDDIAAHERQDRGSAAHNLYIVAPPLTETTPDRPDPLRQPTRGALMPAILVEVGSITLPAEHTMLLTDDGAAAAARGIFNGLASWLGSRELAGRVAVADAEIGALPAAVGSDGPPYRAGALPDGPLRLRVTNTGTRAWGAGARLVGGWQVAEDPYLYGVPDGVSNIGPDLPALGPGASMVVEVELPPEPGTAQALAWFSLRVDGQLLADHGSPALQLGSGAP